MSYVLGNLQPNAVFKYFEELTRIPRESDNEKAVSDYLVKFAKENGLEVIQEECLNIIIKKPATAGYEHLPAVILQGHMDMVCVKAEGSNHDFTKDPVPLVVDGDFIRTNGTTLGADNGVAVAMSMAILTDNTLQHPAIEALITVAEETGMDGAFNLDGKHLKGQVLINIDSEEEGVMLASCAGGVNNLVYVPIERTAATAGRKAFELTIKGLMGGHSGMEINKNRANAIKLMGRTLEYMADLDLEVAHFSGGEKMNAIAKVAKATILVKESDVAKFNEVAKQAEATFKNEFQTADPNLRMELVETAVPTEVFSKKTTQSTVDLMRLIPYGVQTMSANIAGLVESSNNIGVLETKDNDILFTSAVRSSVKSLKDELNRRIEVAAKLTGARMELVADYPEWEYRVNSDIRPLLAATYKDITGKEMHLDAIHAGLECGLLKEKLGDIDMVSIGPNLFDVHTPEEHLSVSSTQRVYSFLVEVLKRMK